MTRVVQAQLIHYQPPQYLVIPIGDPSDADDLAYINDETQWEVVDKTRGWDPYNYIIRAWDDERQQAWTYLARVEN